MDINLNNIKSAADFEDKLNQIAEAFDGDFVIKARGNDTLSVQKSGFFGRIWQRLLGRSKVDTLISSFILQNKDYFHDYIKKSEAPKIKKISLFVNNKLIDKLGFKPVEFASGSSTLKANALFFSRFPHFSNTTREKMKKQDPVRVDGFSKQVIQHLIDSASGLKNLESLPKDKWAEFYALADYLDMSSLKDEVMDRIINGMEGSQAEVFIPLFVELLPTLPKNDHRIDKLIKSLAKQSNEYLKSLFYEIRHLEPNPGLLQVYYEFAGLLKVRGFDIESDDLYLKAANLGSAEAQYMMGFIEEISRFRDSRKPGVYDYGNYFEIGRKVYYYHDWYHRAYDWYKMAAKQGHAKAIEICKARDIDYT